MALKIFYLDDEVELCENFADLYNTDNVCVTTFSDPAQAVEAAKSNPPDLFFFDYRLPGTTGDQVAQLMDPKIPKFLITGDMTVVTTYKFLRVFSKPCKEADILEAFRQYSPHSKG